MARRKRSSLTKLASSAGLAGFHTGVTLWYRLPILAFACHPFAKQRESEELGRMVSEKAKAYTDGIIAAQQAVIAITADMMRGKLDPVAAATSVTAASLEPAFRAVRANSKRLNGRRR